MARSLVQEATDEQIMGLIEEWVELLARDRYEDAFDLIPASARWTPTLLKDLIERGGNASPVDADGGLRVTSPLAARRAGYARRVRRWGDPMLMKSLGHVEYDLPLDGKWPDTKRAGKRDVRLDLRLTALFDLTLDDRAVTAEFFDLQLCSVLPDQLGKERRFRMLRFAILQTFGAKAPSAQAREPQQVSVPMPDRGVLQQLIGEQFKRPKPRWLPRLTNYDPRVLDVERIDDGGFFQKHVLLDVHVEGSFLEHHPLPSATSIGLFAWDGIHLRYLNHMHPENFELVLQAEVRPLNEADGYALAAILADALLRLGNNTHVVLRTPDDMQTALRVTYELNEAEFTRVSTLIRPPVLTGHSGAGWLLTFFALHGWMHEKRTLSRHEYAFSPNFSITHRQQTISKSIFSTILPVVY